VNTAKNVNDHRPRRGRLCHPPAEEPIGDQDAETGAWVRLKQEEHGLAVFLRLLDAERAEHAVVECIVEEENLRRLDDDGRQRKKSHRDNSLHAAAQNVIRTGNYGANHGIGNHRENAAEDAE